MHCSYTCSYNNCSVFIIIIVLNQFHCLDFPPSKFIVLHTKCLQVFAVFQNKNAITLHCFIIRVINIRAQCTRATANSRARIVPGARRGRSGRPSA